MFDFLFFFNENLGDGDRVNWCGVFTHRIRLGGGSGNGINHLHTLSDLTEDDVVFRKSFILVHDEELRPVSIRSRVSHGNSATGVLASKRFIGKFVTRSTGTSASGVTALDHETVKSTVEDGVVVKIVFS